MRTIADHLLDITQNSVSVGSKKIEINFSESFDEIKFEVIDDGCGMNPDQMSKIFDPFYTTKGKKFGLGLPLFKEYAEMTGGCVLVNSREGDGTTVKGLFKKTIDCQPVGDIASVFATLVISSRNIMWKITRCKHDDCYEFSSADIRGLDFTNPRNIKMLFEYFKRLEDILINKVGGAKDAGNS